MSDDTIRVLQQQLAELQSQLSFQEDTIQTLNDVVSDQQRDIMDLKSTARSLGTQLQHILHDLDVGEGSDIVEKPPHY